MMQAPSTEELLQLLDPTGPQSSTLLNPDNATNQPAGDANANFQSPNYPMTLMSTPLNFPQKIETQVQPATTTTNTESNASAKSKSADDFDVNEYFARLQGTRYVSAPLNLLTEDKNANLEATEENLEEINLNDDKSDGNAVVTQSFTSDIAQNFSQLPTVLPQVASAVFSSFSNMLSMKSRDQTPEVATPQATGVGSPQANMGYQEVQFGSQREAGKADVLMEISKADEAKEFAPPPKEPPAVGTTSYRLPTKKKYAQIPGLSSGDKVQIPSYNPVNEQTNVPAYFTPTSTDIQIQNPSEYRQSYKDTQYLQATPDLQEIQNVQGTHNLQETQNLQETLNQQSFNMPGQTTVDNFALVQTSFDQSKMSNPTSFYNIFNPSTESHNPFNANNQLKTTQDVKPDPFKDNKEIISAESSAFYPIQENPSQGTPSAVIPPPPMFTNARRDSQTNQAVGKTILPPSVARRIAANHPGIPGTKFQVPAAFNQNIFVPAIDKSKTEIVMAETTNFQQPPSSFSPEQYTSLQSNIFTPSTPSEGFRPLDASENVTLPKSFTSEPSMLPPPPRSFQETSATTKHDSLSVLPPPPKSVAMNTVQNSESIAPPPMFSMPQSDDSAKSSSMFTSPSTILSSTIQSTPRNQESVAPPPMMFDPSSFHTEKGPSFTKRGLTTPGSQTSVKILEGTRTLPPPTFFNPGKQTEISKAEESQPKSKNLTPPPTFFNPSTMQAFTSPEIVEQPTQNVPLGASQVFQPCSSVEPPKVIYEPPKSTENLLASEPPKRIGIFCQPSLTEPPTIMYEAPKSTGILSQTSTLEPPKVIYEPPKSYDPSATITGNFPQPGTSVEPPKVMAEPPKASGNLSYRMTKKKPQYYAGHIVGVGAISNNVKPTIPVVESSDYQSRLFTPTPEQTVQEVVNAPVPNINQYSVPYGPTVPINQSAVPFDISRPVENVATIPSSMYSIQNVEPSQQDYNTVFDVSRPATDIYEPQQESKGFGIIGSLKSKLSALDINKIHSSVTTFFDPAYNNVKKEADENNSSTTNMPSFEHYAHSKDNQGTNFEIFVPNVEQHQTGGQGYEYQAIYPSIRSQCQGNQQNYQTQYLYSHYPNQGQDYPPFSYYTEEQSTPSSIPVFNQPNNLDCQQRIIETRNQSAVDSTRFLHKPFNVPPTVYTRDNVDESGEDSAVKEEYYHISQNKPAAPDSTATSNLPFETKHTLPTLGITAEKTVASESMLGSPAAKEPFEIVPQRKDLQNPSAANTIICQQSLFDAQTGIDEPQTSIYFGSSQLITEPNAPSAINFINMKFTKQTKATEERDKNCVNTTSYASTPESIEKVANLSFFTAKPVISIAVNPTFNTPKTETIPTDYNLATSDTKATEDLISKLLDTSEDLSMQTRDYGWNEEIKQSTEKSEDISNVYFGNKAIETTHVAHNVEAIDDSKVDTVVVSSTPLYGLSTMLANKSKELKDLEDNIDNIVLSEIPGNIDTIFNRGTNVSFFDIYSGNEKVLDNSQDKDLNIYETCREVNVLDKANDLTSKLIDNITAPIQLSNPVAEIPLTENYALVPPENFDSKQFEEISHITEETIETIQVQSVTELLEDDMLKADVGGYVWSVDKPAISKIDDYIQQDPLKSIGFLGGSLFSDNPIPSIPRNASDELKAEFKCHEESPVILPRQMSLPSAPPIEDEDKSETIDVHSIEQDATKDFLGEEFIIEPSETDDDKIEYKERESSYQDETLEEVDSFTNRIEKFKQLDQIVNQVIEKTSPIFGLPATSPSLPIASYFDTGNYAADTHYKNLNSPPNYGHSSVGSPPQGMRVPPGFEEEYQIRLSGLSDLEVPGRNKNDPITQTPDTSTQTRPTYSPTFNTALVLEEEYQRRISGLELPGRNKNDPKPQIPDTSTQTKPTYSPTFSTASGIEDEYQRRLSGLSTLELPGRNKNDPIPQIPPDTNSQTRPTFSPNFSTAQSRENNSAARFSISTIMTDSIKEISPVHEASYPVFDLFGAKHEGNIPPLALFASSNDYASDKSKIRKEPESLGLKEEIKLPEVSNLYGAVKEESNIPRRLDTFAAFTQQKKRAEDEFQPTIISDIFSQQKDEASKGNLKEKRPLLERQFSMKEDVKDEDVSIQNPPLPDPMNFFSTMEEPVQKPEETSFNRLASYFASPSKPEPSKPFFELSQGQDHYRHASKNNLTTTSAINRNIIDVPNIYRKELASKINSQHQNKGDENHSKNLYNIPESQYITNLNLVKDLASTQYFNVDSEQVVRTVNYFTVEYDNENPNIFNDINIGEPEHHSRDPNIKANKEFLPDYNADDKTLKTIIKKCKFCSDFTAGYFQKYITIIHDRVDIKEFNLKVKTCMDTDRSDSKHETDKNMDPASSKNQSVTVSLDDTPLGEDSRDGVILGSENRSNSEYTPVKHHWFYRVDVEGKSIWRGFSVFDSQALEQAYHSPDLREDTLVPTDGGRFDVNIVGRLRIPVYWLDKPTNVRRCSWFYKGTTDARYVPYTEQVAEKLEEEYRHGMTTGEWHRRLVLPSNELVVMHGPGVMVHFLQPDRDGFSAPPMFQFGKRVYRNPLQIRVSHDQKEKVDHLVFMVHGAGEYRHQKAKYQSTMRPRVVRRSHDESEIEDIEPSSIDHLLLLCHGVGSACDMRFRSVEEVVDDFRATSLQLLQSHYRHSYDNGVVGRIEVLPISWHTTLHSGETGVDRRLARITLDSIPRLRSFTNDTVLDVLFYTSPVFCQTIVDTVCSELNRIHKIFCTRNPNFNGDVSLGGHSLGSVILYDLLCHQTPINQAESPGNFSSKNFVQGLAGTGQPMVKYPKLNFDPIALYAMGSPIAIFECIRGVESLGVDFKLPTCRHFFNIFHPYDPIAYRIEPLVNQHLKKVKPLLIPHHKGRKRMHLELKDTMARVGADLKQKLVESIKSTWANVWRSQPHRQLEKVVEEEMEREQLNQNDSKDEQSQVEDETVMTPEMLGKLNDGRRIDHVLQEAPFEMINEYLFAMSSHVCYWESEDTMLLMLREIYDALGVQPDSTVPQPNLTVQRTRTVADDNVIANMAEHPSTSRGGQT